MPDHAKPINFGPSSSEFKVGDDSTLHLYSLWIGGKELVLGEDGSPDEWGKVLQMQFDVPHGTDASEARNNAMAYIEEQRPAIAAEFGELLTPVVMHALRRIIVEGKTYTRTMSGNEIMSGEL